MRQQLLKQQQPLVHELQVVVVRPDVGVLDLFAEGAGLAIDLGRGLRAAQGDLADIVGAGVEGRVDVDEVHLAAEPVREKVRQHFFVVSMEQQPILGIGGRPVAPFDPRNRPRWGRRRLALDMLGGERRNVR